MTNAQNDQADHRPLTPQQAATALGVSPQTIRRRGAELGRKVFGRWQIDPARVAALTAGETDR